MDPNSYAPSEENHVKTEFSDELVDVKPILSRKRQRPFGSEPFTSDEESAIRQKLDVALSRSETTQRPGPGGCRLTYIEGWKVIHDANQIFGFNGWSSQVVKIDVRYIDENGSRFSACVCATVRVTLRDGCSREDRGGGVADNMRSKGEAILKAEKEAITDATKRTLKNFGLRLGLSLYDRQHLRELNRPVQNYAARPQMNSLKTPVVNRTIPFIANAPSSKVPIASPVTPASASHAVAQPEIQPNGKGAGEQYAQAAHIEMQRQQAIARRQACLRAKASKTTVNNSGNTTSGVPAATNANFLPNKIAGPPPNVASRSDAMTGGGRGSNVRQEGHADNKAFRRPGSGYAPGGGRGGNFQGGGVTRNGGIAQNEIDELSAMAFADL